MTREQIVDKYATHIAGKLARFAFADVKGPGLEDRLRGMVADVEKAIRQCVDEASRLASATQQKETPK